MKSGFATRMEIHWSWNDGRLRAVRGDDVPSIGDTALPSKRASLPFSSSITDVQDREQTGANEDGVLGV